MKKVDIATPKKVIYGKGKKDAKIMILGGFPGPKEDKTGVPFGGREGIILDECLGKAGILRSQCFLSYVVKEFPGYKNDWKYIKVGKKMHVSELYRKYEEYLWDEIREIDPNVIVTLGDVPLYALTRETSSYKYRGSKMESTTVTRENGEGYKVICTIDPIKTDAQYVWKHFIGFDMKQVMAESDTPDLNYHPREYIIAPTFEQSMLFLEECKKHPRHAFDIEVSHNEVSCISFAYNREEAISIPFTKGEQMYFSPEQEYDIWMKIAELLEDSELESLGQNVTFDSTFLLRKFGIRAKNLQDTMIAQAINFPDFPKDLGFITSIYSDIPYYKDEGKEHFNKGTNTSTQPFWVYNAKDSIVLMDAFPKQLEELKKLGNYQTYEHQRRLIPVLLYLAEHGIQMDTESMKEESDSMEQTLFELELNLNDLVGYNINPRSPKQLKEYFYGPKDQGGLNIKPYLNKGKPTTNEGALIRLARGTKNRDPVPAAQLLLEHRKLSKLKGTYLDMDLDDDGRVRSSMNPVGTRYGRLSSSKTIFGTGANLQNQPPVMKKFMVPDPNHVIYEIDLGQAENRIVAYIGPEPKMMEAFETGADIHSRTASYIFRMPEEEIYEMHHAGVMCTDIGTGSYTHRYWGKKANHAFNYGQGYSSFSYQVEIPEHQGKMIHQKYHSAYPGVRKMHNWVKNELKQSRTLTNLFGRKCMFLDRLDWKMYEEAYAFIPQSSVADIVNRHGLNYVYYNQDEFKDVKILNQVHDSIVFEISLDVSLEKHAELIKKMCNSLEKEIEFRGRTFSIPADLTVLPINMKDGVEVSGASTMATNELATIIKEAINEKT